LPAQLSVEHLFCFDQQLVDYWSILDLYRPGSRKTVPKNSENVPEPELNGAMATIHAFGPFRLDAEAEILFRGAEPLTVGKRGVALLRVLVERSGAPVSKDTLIDAAWPGLAVEEANLTVQIAALRKVLSQEPGGDKWIETLPRRGYRFVGPVATSNSPLDAHALVRAARSDVPETLAIPDKPSIAVLPFANMSGDKQQEYFSDGITEDIITELSRFSDLFVIARNSSFQYKAKSPGIRQVGRELGVRYVLEGSIRQAGARVRITTQLIDALTGTQRWAERYDRNLEDVFTT
jgi:TolB-like protein